MKELTAILVDKSKPLWERYRAMFTLRNLSSDEAIRGLGKGLYCEESALFRHEIAYVLGQIQSPLSVPELSDRLKKKDESPMVRHECAEALGGKTIISCYRFHCNKSRYISTQDGSPVRFPPGHPPNHIKHL